MKIPCGCVMFPDRKNGTNSCNKSIMECVLAQISSIFEVHDNDFVYGTHFLSTTDKYHCMSLMFSCDAYEKMNENLDHELIMLGCRRSNLYSFYLYFYFKILCLNEDRPYLVCVVS